MQWGGDPGILESLYLEIRQNKSSVSHLVLKAGTVLANVDIVPEHKLRLTRFYKEWLQPQGFVDTIGAVPEKS